MKATFNGMYRKKGTGNLVFTYLVNGTAEEIETYKTIQETKSNRAAGTWPEANGKPLYYVNPDLILQRGGQPQPAYNLIFNNDKTNVILDESQQMLAHFQAVHSASVNAEAQLAAEIRLGLRTVAPRQALFTTPVAPAIETPATAAPTTLLDKIANNVEENIVKEQLHS